MSAGYRVDQLVSALILIDSLTLNVLQQLVIVHPKALFQVCVGTCLVDHVLLQRGHLSLIPLDVCLGGGLRTVYRDVHRIRCIASCCLQLYSYVILFCHGSVNFIILNGSLLDGSLKLVWQVDARYLEVADISVALLVESLLELLLHATVDSVRRGEE